MSVKKDLFNGLEKFLTSMKIDFEKSDFFSLPVFGVNADFESVVLWPNEFEWKTNQVFTEKFSEDRLQNCLKETISNHNIFCDFDGINYGQNPFCSEAFVEKTALKWGDDGSFTEFSYVQRSEDCWSLVYVGDRLKIQLYNNGFVKKCQVLFGWKLRKNYLSCGLNSVEAKVTFDDRLRQEASHTFFATKDALVGKTVLDGIFLSDLFRLVDANLRERGTSLWEEIARQSPGQRNAKDVCKTDYFRWIKGGTRVNRGIKLGLLCGATENDVSLLKYFKHEDSPYVNLTKFFMNQNDKRVGFFLDRIHLGEGGLGIARLVYINGQVEQEFSLSVKKTKKGLECHRMSYIEGKAMASVKPFLILPMTGNTLRLQKPFSPMFGIEGGGDKVIRYLDDGDALPKKSGFKKRLWFVGQHAKHIGQETGMVLANVVLNVAYFLVCFLGGTLHAVRDCCMSCLGL